MHVHVRKWTEPGGMEGARMEMYAISLNARGFRRHFNLFSFAMNMPRNKARFRIYILSVRIMKKLTKVVHHRGPRLYVSALRIGFDASATRDCYASALRIGPNALVQ